MTSADTPTIRFATREDVPTILALIHELAAYEHASSSVEATISSLLSTLAFAPSPSTTSSPITPTPANDAIISPSRPARCLLAFSPTGAPAGMALFFYNYSTWRAAPGIFLEDLFVRESERGRGVGGRLLGRLAKEVLDLGGARLEWSVLKWNEPSIRFYEGIGAKVMSEWQGMRVDGEELGRLAGKA